MLVTVIRSAAALGSVALEGAAQWGAYWGGTSGFYRLLAVAVPAVVLVLTAWDAWRLAEKGNVEETTARMKARWLQEARERYPHDSSSGDS